MDPFLELLDSLLLEVDDVQELLDQRRAIRSRMSGNAICMTGVDQQLPGYFARSY